MRDVTVPEIEQPERFFPDPVLVRAPKVRRLDDGYGEFWLEGKGEWERIHPICIAVLEGLERGDPFETIAERIPDQPGFRRPQLRAVARLYLWKLSKLGHVRFDLEPPPDVFHDRYRRVKELGRGGLGVAHLCEDTRTGRKVVIKHSWGVIQDVARGQRAIANEARVLAAFDHPGIPRVHDLFEVRGLLHLVRDYADGKDLWERYHRVGIPDRARRRDVLRQVADAIAHMHERGYLFFDARPANYVEDPEGRVHAIDVGNVAPHEHGVATVRGARGSPGYTAPELLVGGTGGWRQATPRADVFGVGRVIWFLATGRTPGRRWREEQFAAALAESSMDEDEKALALECCRDDPAQRPADLREVIRRLG